MGGEKGEKGKKGKDKGKGKGKDKGKGKGKGKFKGKDKGKGKKGDGEEGEEVPEQSATSIALHAAARGGDAAKLEELLADAEAVKEDINSPDQHRRTPLHLACFFGHPALAEKLIDCGADPNIQAMDGFLPLHFAAQQGQLEAVKVLIRKIGAAGKFGAVRTHVNRVVRKGKRSSLHLAVQKGHAEVARFLVVKGASTELKTAGGQTALELCQSDELRATLTGDAAKASEELGPEEPAEEEVEPPAKRRAVAAPGDGKPAAAAAPVAADSLPGVLLRGPLPLDKVSLEADSCERTYPAGTVELADVEWEVSEEDRPKKEDGPVWCFVRLSEETSAGGERSAKLVLQQSSYKLLRYTHFSEEGALMEPEARCNACGLTVLSETSDSLLAFARRSDASADGPEWDALSPGEELDTLDLGKAVGGALVKGPAGPAGALAAADKPVELLALADLGEEAPGGHRHELVVSVRLGAAAADVQKAVGDKLGTDGLIFVPAPGSQAAEPGDAKVVELATFLQDFRVAEGVRRGLQTLQALRG